MMSLPDKHQDIFISEDNTLLECMKALDETASKNLFIVDKQKKLLASVTDGDIRRWILAKGNLKARATEFANYNPKSLPITKQHLAHKYLKDNLLEALPLLDDKGHIIEIVFWNKEIRIRKSNLNIPVVINAGGKGTRLYPYTKILPKPLMPIGEIPIAERIVNRFRDNGCSVFFMIVNHKKNMIKAYFNEVKKDYHLTYIDEDISLGTGGGIQLLKNKIKSPFILSNCDTILEEDYSNIYKHHIDNNNTITVICSLKSFTIPYGIIEIENNGIIEDFREKPKVSYLVNTGCYIVNESVINEIKPDTNMSFPEIIQEQKKNGNRVGIFPISENKWLDMGQFNEMEKMTKKICGDK